MSRQPQPSRDAPPPSPQLHASAFRSLGPALIVGLVGMALYAVTLGGTWVYDDIYHLFNDWRTQPRRVLNQPPKPLAATQPTTAPQPQFLPPAIEDPRQWHLYLTESYNDAIDNLYRPVTSLSYAVQATIHGRSERAAWAWHLFNVLLYGIVCAQVALLAGRMARADEDIAASRGVAGWIALCAGLLFATHPVHVEVVAGIVGRAELICAAGFLGGLLVLTRPLTPLRIAAFAGLMLLSIGGKEQGLVLPAVALVWYVSRRRAGLPSLTRWRRASAEARPAELLQEDDGFKALAYEPVGRRTSDDLAKALIIAIALPLAGYLLAREQLLGLSMAWPKNLLDPTIQPLRDAAGADRWLMPVALAGRYLSLLIWPGWLSIDYGSVVIEPPQRLEDQYLWLGFVAIAVFVAAMVHALRTRWVAGLTMLAGFAFTYGIASNFLTLIGTVFGERLLFLPSAFFLIYLVLLAIRLAGLGAKAPTPSTHQGKMRAIVAITIVLAALGSVRSFTYAARWNDRVAFYQYQSRVQPQSVRIWMLLGEELRQQGQLEEAARAAANATDLKPDYWSNWVLRARIAQERGLLADALEYAKRAVAARTDGITTAVRAQIENAYIQQRDQAPGTRPAGDDGQ